MEFSEPISLLALSEIKIHLEDVLGMEVDLIHGPVQAGDLIEVDEEIELNYMQHRDYIIIQKALSGGNAAAYFRGGREFPQSAPSGESLAKRIAKVCIAAMAG